MNRGPSFDARAFALTLCKRAMRIRDAALAEVFVRVARSWRCEIPSSHATHSTQQHEESGVALRVWDRSGREGFVHADAVSNRDIGELERSARWQLTETSPRLGLIPRLPSGSENERDVRLHEDGSRHDRDIDESLTRGTSWIHEVVEAFSAFRSSTLAAREIWIERGAGRTWIVNSLGRDVTFPFAVGSAGIHLSAQLSTMRYAIPLGDEDAEPRAFVAGAVRQTTAIADASAAPVPVRESPVLLSPRASAQWLQWVFPRFIRSDSEQGRSGKPPDLSVRPGFHIVDEPDDARILYDGEGRSVGRRTYLHDGQMAGAIIDSRDPSRTGAGLEPIGPMRRDSFRDRPYPGPMALRIPPDGSNPRSLIESVSEGLFVTGITPRVAPGSETFLAEVRGLWIEQGKPKYLVPPTLIEIEGCGGLGRVMARGGDPEPGPPGLLTVAPSLLFESAKLASF